MRIGLEFLGVVTTVWIALMSTAAGDGRPQRYNSTATTPSMVITMLLLRAL